MLLAALMTSIALVNAQYCTPTVNSCQVQSDPLVNTFAGPTWEFNQEGTFYALNSVELQVQLVIGMHYAKNLGKNVYVVDQVIYTCGGDTKKFTTATVSSTIQKLTCSSGTCTGNRACSLSIVKHVDPIENINVQEIRYMGTQGLGGLCYGNPTGCAAANVPSAVNTGGNKTVPANVIATPPSGNIPGVYVPPTTCTSFAAPNTISVQTPAAVTPAVTVPKCVQTPAAYTVPIVATTAPTAYMPPVINTYQPSTNLYSASSRGAVVAGIISLVTVLLI